RQVADPLTTRRAVGLPPGGVQPQGQTDEQLPPLRIGHRLLECLGRLLPCIAAILVICPARQNQGPPIADELIQCRREGLSRAAWQRQIEYTKEGAQTGQVGQQFTEQLPLTTEPVLLSQPLSVSKQLPAGNGDYLVYR